MASACQQRRAGRGQHSGEPHQRLLARDTVHLHVLGVLEVTDFRSPILSGAGAALVKRDFSTDFALKLLLKDANLIDRFAQDLNSPIPAVAVIRVTIKSAVNQGWGDQNASAMIKAIELEGRVQVGAP